MHENDIDNEKVQEKNKINSKKRNFLFCILAVILFCLIFTICSSTSPLYPFEDESHVFFNVGKAILNGRVLYRDVFDQKGLLIYLIQIPAYLISNTNFLGVWLIQLVSIIPSAILAYKISNKFMKSPIKSYISSTIFSLILFTSQSFGSGLSVEVYVLPCFLYAIYCILKYYENNKEIPYMSIFINGIFAGIMLWTKYSLLGFYVGWMGYICIRLMVKKNMKRAIFDAIIFLLGVVIVTIPCVLYFVINDSVEELIKYYFLINVSGYGAKISIMGYIKSIVKQTYWNIPMVICFLIGVIYLKKKIKLDSKLILIISFLTQYIIAFSHGAMFAYYLFAFAPFVIFAPIAVTDFITNNINFETSKIQIISLVSVSIICLACAVAYLPSPRYFLRNPEKLAQYQFAEYMHSKYENPTCIDYGFYEGGFKTVANIIPNTWAFCKINMDNKEIEEDQLNTIKNKKVDFVILRTKEDEELQKVEYLDENYKLVKKASQYRVNIFYTYYLYEVKS